MKQPEKIFVTGLGVTSALGSTVKAFTTGLREGACGLRAGAVLRCGTPARTPIGEVRDLDALCESVFDARKARRFDPVARLTLYTCLQALRDAGLLDAQNRWVGVDPQRIGLILGTGVGGTHSTELFFRKVADDLPQSANPSLFPETVPNAATGHLTIELGIEGPSTTFTQKQTSTECALAYAAQLLQSRDLDLVVTGAVEDVTNWNLIAHEACHALGRDLKPFDRRRTGTLLGEGGAVFVLEKESRVMARRAKIYGRIRAVNLGGVACPVGTWPKLQAAESLAQTLSRFLTEHADVRGSLGWINASALGSPTLDDLEARVLKKVFGAQVPVSALHGALGSFLCSSSLRLAASLVALGEGFIPPTVGLEDAAWEGVDFVKTSARSLKHEHALIHTLADGGAYALTLLSAR